MNRYHKKVYFPQKHKEDLISFTFQLNRKEWQYTKHCIDNLKLRALNLSQLLYWIKNEVWLDYKNIFEYYTINDKITKVCYRLSYNKAVDIILILGQDKQIITIYYNTSDDKHYTLKKQNYATV